MKRGEMYWADLSPVIGSEQGGFRPVLIIQNDIGNKKSPTIIVAPATSREKTELPTHVTVTIDGVKNTIMLEQIRSIAKARVIAHFGALTEEDMEKVNQALLISLDLGKTQLAQKATQRKSDLQKTPAVRPRERIHS